jgi:hypothetical protein
MSSALFRQDFVPMVAGYLIIMATLALGLHLAAGHRPGPAPGMPPKPAVLPVPWDPASLPVPGSAR